MISVCVDMALILVRFAFTEGGKKIAIVTKVLLLGIGTCVCHLSTELQPWLD